MVVMSGIVMLKMYQNHFAIMQNGCYVSYSFVENEPKSPSNHTEWLLCQLYSSYVENEPKPHCKHAEWMLSQL